MIELDRAVGGVRISTWGFVVAIIIFLLYLSGTTKPILNFNNNTNTIMYPEQCFKPQSQITQEYINLCSIPQDYVKTDNIIIGFIIVMGLIVTLISDKGKIPEMADITEAREIVSKYMDSHKNIKLQDTGDIIDIGTYHISPHFLLKEERIGKERIPERYVLDVEITDSEGMPFNVRSYVEPFKRYIKGFVSANKELEESDRCSNCGKEFDVEFVDTEDYRKFKKIKEGSKD